MGKRGPLPMPDNVRALRGVAKRKSDPAPVKLAPAAPNPPASLKGEALAEWKRIVPELDERGLLAKVDRALLVEYCCSWALSRRAHAELEASGLVVKGQKSNDVRSPLWQMWRESTTLTAALAKELLITPSSRLRASMPPAPAAAQHYDDIFD